MPYVKNSTPSKKSSMKMKDLSGDGKVTEKDVLIGRGVLNEDGSPVKAKGSPYMLYGKEASPATMMVKAHLLKWVVVKK